MCMRMVMVMHARNVGGWMDKWMNGWINGWIDEWMDGWMDEWIDGWMKHGIGYESYCRLR